MKSRLDRLYEKYDRDKIIYGYNVAEHNYRKDIEIEQFHEKYGYYPITGSTSDDFITPILLKFIGIVIAWAIGCFIGMGTYVVIAKACGYIPCDPYATYTGLTGMIIATIIVFKIYSKISKNNP